jgi:hypothetical protein
VLWSKILYNKIGRVDKIDKIVDGYVTAPSSYNNNI